MSEEIEEVTEEGKTEASEEVPAKPRFRIKKPNPIVYFILGPFILTFVSYIVMTNIFLTSDLEHEAKLEILMALESEEAVSEDPSNADNVLNGEGGSSSVEDGGFLDTHNYFQFPMAFAVNIPETNRNLTFELAVSSFQSGVAAEWFFESFSAFVPALRSDILYHVGKQSLADLQSEDFQRLLLLELKAVINAKLESLGSKPEISQVLFVRFVVT